MRFLSPLHDWFSVIVSSLSCNVVGDDLCLAALVTVLSQVCDGRKHFVSTLHLQLVSFKLCVACRSVATSRVRVELGMETPRRLSAPPLPSEALPLRAHSLTWRAGDVHVDGIMWKDSLQQLDFGEQINHSIAEVVWPRPLTR